MSKKKPYEATSPIKHNGTRYEIGDTLNLTEEEADGLHVKPANDDGQETDDGGSDNFDASIGSHENDAKPSIAYIEDASEEDLEGFVDPEKEDRVTVLRAWDDRFDTNFADDQE